MRTRGKSDSHSAGLQKIWRGRCNGTLSGTTRLRASVRPLRIIPRLSPHGPAQRSKHPAHTMVKRKSQRDPEDLPDAPDGKQKRQDDESDSDEVRCLPAYPPP